MRTIKLVIPLKIRNSLGAGAKTYPSPLKPPPVLAPKSAHVNIIKNALEVK